VILQKLVDGEETREASRALDLYSRQGLRTLCLAARAVDENEYAMWSQAYGRAALKTQVGCLMQPVNEP
jgi:phospholipid-transporting ATPase